MTPISAAPLRCPEARALVSERLDGAPVGPEVEQHLRRCAGCARFEDSALSVRRALRLPSIADPWADDRGESLTAAVMAAIPIDSGRRPDADRSRRSPSGCDDRSRRSRTGSGRLRGVLAGVAVFALCAAIGFASVHWQGGTMPAVADDRAAVVAQGQVLVHSLQADVTLSELGAAGSPTRQATGTLTYSAPEAVALRLSDGTTSSEVGVNGEVAWRVGRDPGSVRGREPFDPAGWSALEVVVPVDAFGRDPGAVVPTHLGGRPAWQITTTVGQIGELLGAFRTGLDWQPLDASDTATLWLDRDTGVPLRIEITPAADPDRAAWAARQGLVEPTTGPTFVVELVDVAVNRTGAEVPAPPPLTDTRDLGFVDRALSPVELPEPTWLPSGMTAYRSGEQPSQGAAGTVLERTWTNGRSWLKVSGTHQWSGGRLFGDIGPLVRPLDTGRGGPIYRSENGTAVAVHADGIDLVVTGSVSEDELVQVAGSLSPAPRPAPAGWPESSAFSLDDLAGPSGPPGPTRPVLAPDLGTLSGADGAVLERDGSVEVSVTGPGARGI
ncbi:MAG: hypothetical protein ACXWCM_13485, partial [Acidimicrobiales bacterium]